MGTEFFLGMPYFVFNNSDLINSPNFPGIIDNGYHIEYGRYTNENVRDEMINGAYSIWKDKLSLEILIKSEYMIKDV